MEGQRQALAPAVERMRLSLENGASAEEVLRELLNSVLPRMAAPGRRLEYPAGDGET